MKSFEIYENSVGLVSKPRNGDHTGHLVLEDENLIALAVADGVGQHSCDWDASETTCRSVLERFREGRGDLEMRMAGAVEFAHQEVQNLQGESAGALSTIVLVVWEIGAAECRLVSVGDSRIYRVGPGGVKQLTVDDSRSVPVKRGGEVVLQNGTAAFTNALTAAVGTRESLDLRVETSPFKTGEMMALASDGCYELAGFLGFLGQVYERSDLAQAAETIIYRQNEAHGHDDASLILLRRTDYAADEKEKYLAVFHTGGDFRTEKLSGHFMVRVLADHLTDTAGIPDAGAMGEALDYLKRHQLKLTRQDLSVILNNLKDDRKPETKRIWDRLICLAQGC